MTMEQVQAMAVKALEDSVQGLRPKVYIEAYDGIFSVGEGRKTWAATPALFVSPLSSDDQGVKLAVYTLCRATDKGQVRVLDCATKALQRMSGVGRPYLKVAARSLYDKDALASGLRLWVHLVECPHLAMGDVVETSSGPVHTEKQRIKELFSAAYPGIAIGTTQGAEDELMDGSTLPFLVVLAGEGKFERADRRSIKYEQDGKLYAREIRGLARWPITIKAYARSEQEAESLLWFMLPDLPRVTMVEGVNLYTVVGAIEAGHQEAGANVASITVNLEVPAATNPLQVPTFRKTAVVGG